MKKIIFFFFTFCFLIAVSQDQDPKAKLILDDLSKTNKTYKTIIAEVVFTMYNKEKKLIEKPQIWKIQVKGQKFRLEIPGTSIVCDGVTLWNYNKDAKEVTIKTFDPISDEQNPSKIFNMYETGYKYTYDSEKKIGLVNCSVINLFPAIKPEKKKFHTVKLSIDKIKKQMIQLIMLMKDGGTQVYDIKSLKTNSDLADKLFIFDTKGFKSDQINDERD